MDHTFTFSKPKWNQTEDKKLYETPIFSLNKTAVVPAGQTSSFPFYIINAPEWVNVIALTSQNEIVLVEQYRAGIDESTLEIPGGMADENELPPDVAKRELLEETGFRSQNWVSLGKVSSNPAIMSNYTHVFLARDCIKTDPQQTDATEDIAIHTLPLAEFFNLIRNGTLHHALVVAAVTKLLLNADMTDLGLQL